MMLFVRTTVTLEDDLAERLKKCAHQRQTSVKVALNTLLRRGLGAQEVAPSSRRWFVVEERSGRFRQGIDPAKLNQLVDLLETEELCSASRR
jgi:hypothetical protein